MRAGVVGCRRRPPRQGKRIDAGQGPVPTQEVEQRITFDPFCHQEADAAPAPEVEQARQLRVRGGRDDPCKRLPDGLEATCSCDHTRAENLERHLPGLRREEIDGQEVVVLVGSPSALSSR